MEVIIILVVVALVARHFNRRGTAAPRPELGPVGWVDGTNWAVVRPLARVEVRRLLRHPAFLVGVVLSPFILDLATTAADYGDSWRDASPGIALGLVPFGWLTIIAAHLLTSRPRRTGTDTLLATLPAPQPVRTTGLLLTAGAPFAAAAVMAVGWVVFLQSQTRVISGSPRWAEIGVGLLIAAGSVTVGVAVARFLPHPAVGVAAALASALIQARVFEMTAWPWHLTEASRFRFLAFLAPPTNVDPVLEIRPAGWHLVYLVGLVVLMGCVALVRHGAPPVLAGVMSAAVALTAVAGWAQTRPPSEKQIATMVLYLHKPQTSQVCEQTGSVRYCAFKNSGNVIPSWRARVQSVLALVPAAVAARELDVTARVPTVIGQSDCSPQPYTDHLVPEVSARLDPDTVWPADGHVHPGTDALPCSQTSVHGLFLAMQTGAWVVGLPPAPHGRDVRCVADRQARSVIALWLGTAATPDGARNLRRFLSEERTSHLRFDGWNYPPMWGVRFATPDAAMALAMLKLPTADVAGVIAANWTTLIDPATPASLLASLVGVGAGDAVLEPVTGEPSCA